MAVINIAASEGADGGDIAEATTDAEDASRSCQSNELVVKSGVAEDGVVLVLFVPAVLFGKIFNKLSDVMGIMEVFGKH